MLQMFILLAILAVTPTPAHCAESDTLMVFDAASTPLGQPGGNWEHVRPNDHHAFTNYEIVRSVNGNYLRAVSSSTGSWLEYDLGQIDVSEYPVMEWAWMVTKLPETGWEMNEEWDDFAIRVELVYDFKGGKTPFNILRKGLINTLFRGYPPELVVSYVWSVNVPPDDPYRSPSDSRTLVIPMESEFSGTDRWLSERRNILADLNSQRTSRKDKPLYLKKIRIRADTNDSSTIAESGVKSIMLIGGNEALDTLN